MDKDRGRIAELEKKQRKFDQMLAEEKAVSEKLSAERDTAERDARQYETKVRLGVGERGGGRGRGVRKTVRDQGKIWGSGEGNAGQYETKVRFGGGGRGRGVRKTVRDQGKIWLGWGRRRRERRTVRDQRRTKPKKKKSSTIQLAAQLCTTPELFLFLKNFDSPCDE